jgi:hypothetical protein
MSEKIANEIPVMMQKSAQHLRQLATSNVELQTKVSSLARENKIMKLARRMEVRGLQPNLTFEEKVAQLSEVDDTKLATMEQAVEMAAGGVRLATVAVSDKTAGFDSAPSGGDDALESFINSGEALTG